MFDYHVCDFHLVELEKLEKKYLDKYFHFLMYAKDALFDGFNTANDIRDQWTDKWNAGFDKGAERIVYSFFNTQGFGKHDSTPVASDLFFQTTDAFIHIDLKTVASTNIGDGNTKHDIEQNQSSYPSSHFVPNLPFYYTVNGITKPCLTYFIVIIYEKDNFSVPCMYISCMPNGSLSKIYGERIVQRGKNYGKNARYAWEINSDFEFLPKNQDGNKPKRVRAIHYDDKDNETNVPCNICNENHQVWGKINRRSALVTCKRCDGTGTKIEHYLKDNLKHLRDLYTLERHDQ
jgi:hypothetical protein